jgi:epoxyqueuosine reductase
VQQLTEDLKQAATESGFVLSGVTLAARPDRYPQLLAWLNAGYAGSMNYIAQRREAYASPASVLDGCSTLLMLAYPYRTENPAQPATGQARVARYAWGTPDYHDDLFARLKALQKWLLQRQPTARVRGVVDTAPLLERELAERAGLGWVGKNTLLLNRQWGSYFFLAALLTDVPLVPDPPQPKGYCGTCRACLDACPTQAFPEPYVLDATKCISYWTIEHRGPIPPEIAPGLGDWMFGCDICQEVCPWNRRTEQSPSALPSPLDSLHPADLIEILGLDEASFRARYRKTPLWRAKRSGILRNAALVLGNQQHRPALDALLNLMGENDPAVVAAAQWAIAQIDHDPQSQRASESERSRPCRQKPQSPN